MDDRHFTDEILKLLEERYGSSQGVARRFLREVAELYPEIKETIFKK